MTQKPIPPPTFTSLEPEEKKGAFELIQGLAEILIALLGLSVVLFGVFAVSRAFAPPLHKVAWNYSTGAVKPDAAYAGGTASVPTAESRDTDDIIYFAPTAATLPVLVSSQDGRMPKGADCASTVPMLITINPQGKPVNPAFRTPPGCGLEQPALAAVMNWRFRPGQLDGKALAVGALVQVHFK